MLPTPIILLFFSHLPILSFSLSLFLYLPFFLLTNKHTDDNIAIKSGIDDAGILFGMPSQNILIEDCHFGPGNGVAIGRHVAVVRCVVLFKHRSVCCVYLCLTLGCLYVTITPACAPTDRLLYLPSFSRGASCSETGGGVHNVTVRNVKMRLAGHGVYMKSGRGRGGDISVRLSPLFSSFGLIGQLLLWLFCLCWRWDH